MQKTPSRFLFKNCIVWTGEVGSAQPREVLVENRRITACASRIASEEVSTAVAVDCDGCHESYLSDAHRSPMSSECWWQCGQH